MRQRLICVGTIYGDELSCMKECYSTKAVTMVLIRGQFEQGNSKRWLSDWRLDEVVYNTVAGTWRRDDVRNEGWSGEDPSADEVRTSADSRGDQAECNHYGHVLSESPLIVICASCGWQWTGNTDRWTVFGALDLQSCARFSFWTHKCFYKFTLSFPQRIQLDDSEGTDGNTKIITGTLFM